MRWGSSVYVQKKSCSLVFNGGGASPGVSDGEGFDRMAELAFDEREVVTVEVATAILQNECCVPGQGQPAVFKCEMWRSISRPKTFHKPSVGFMFAVV